ncbi:DNA-processing protein DprA [Kineosporia sp. J2-2]|uniref:DNA-processing protein DprA n=1 Tax=Kineosporia corallincola TaxID=2835133 RepID=A0ABS5TFF3_9ACTN|nr:DNA-processing protein DprA [Kineosporia corallincola]MBT0769815.1 DNA-processing protein DprA [Kineosporia corallincola]
MSGTPHRSDEEERLARAAWSRLAEPGDARAGRWLAEMGAVAALAGVREGRAPGAERYAGRLTRLDPARDLHNLGLMGGRLLIPGDPEWPEALHRLDTEMPFCLYVRGPLRLDQACSQAVSIVGARAATAYGEHVAGELAMGCADRGLTVVSGAALGIDAAAHRGALAAGGPTLAVLAGGLDRAYPAANDLLIGEIARSGALVSEVPPGSAPTKWRFILRNRVIAALGRATCVVEAGVRSGTLGTANWADRLSIPVGAVPGPITSPASYGAHRLLRTGAVCVTSADELCELAGPIGAFVAEEAPVPLAEYDGLEQDDLRVLDALPVSRGAPVTSLCRVAGLDESSLLVALARLELRGLAEDRAGRWRRARTAG